MFAVAFAGLHADSSPVRTRLARLGSVKLLSALNLCLRLNLWRVGGGCSRERGLPVKSWCSAGPKSGFPLRSAVLSPSWSCVSKRKVIGALWRGSLCPCHALKIESHLSPSLVNALSDRELTLYCSNCCCRLYLLASRQESNEISRKTERLKFASKARWGGP